MTLAEASFTCPLDGNQFRYTIALSGTSFGQRLDFRPVGPMMSPRPIPQCPECHFVLYQMEFTTDEITRLNNIVFSGDYRRIDPHNTSYYYLASLLRAMGSGELVVADHLLQASWQAEDREDQPRLHAYLEESLAGFSRVLDQVKAGAPPVDASPVIVQMICGEIERRLSRFSDAEGRFEGILATDKDLKPELQQVIRYQLQLIQRADALPHDSRWSD